MINKIRASMLEALEIIGDGASIAVGGFGVTGAPLDLCDALCELGRKDLHIVANNAGVTTEGVGRLAREKRIRKFTGSFPSNEAFHSQYLAGTVEVELIPQGTMAELAPGVTLELIRASTGAEVRGRLSSKVGLWSGLAARRR